MVNNSLRWAINSVALGFRTRLTAYVQDKYLDNLVYYKINNLDSRIQNPDQLMTQDIERFSDTLAHLYSDMAKPVVDIVLFTYKLGESLGKDAPIAMIIYFALSGLLLRAISPPFARYTAQEQKLEGQFRYIHSRLITHAEEVAFYGGEEREKATAEAAFERVKRHLQKVYKFRFLNGIIDSVFVKYYATALAYLILSKPVFAGTKSPIASRRGGDATKIMGDYSRNTGYLVNLSQAIGRLLLAGRELTRFAGFTGRVFEFVNALEETGNGIYVRPNGKVSECLAKGKMYEVDNLIEFKNVPIVTPGGEVLITALNLRIERGMNTIITGPNGSGKSSLFRILGNLWPVYSGELYKPASDKIFYVPQKPYLSLGNLRDQVIYPDSKETALEKGYEDDDIRDLLHTVHLDYLISREGGFDTIHDWADVLSGGEKQRIAMARLFYHNPQFAILDECTSAVSVDVEGIIYKHAIAMGITLFTVSHRPSLFQYHDYILQFNGFGGYEFKRTEDSSFHMVTSTSSLSSV